MKTRPLGKTGLQVSELAAGGLFLSSYGGEFEQARKALLRAIELGVNYVDTAPGYYIKAPAMPDKAVKARSVR